MRVLITGGLGRIGQSTLARALARGHDVRVLDTRPEPPDGWGMQAIDYRQTDIRDENALLDACQGCDAIIHLAAIPGYTVGRERSIFEINVVGSYNLYQVAERLGIQKIVAAGSINYLGNGFGPHWTEIRYLPIDEAHPGQALDPYAFSKRILEETAGYFYRRGRISTVCFRFPLVYLPEWYPDALFAESHLRAREAVEHLMGLSAAVRTAEIDQLKAGYMTQRLRRIRGEIDYTTLHTYFRTARYGVLMWNFENYWAMLHVQDAAKALMGAVEADWDGVTPLYLADPINNLGLPTQTLVDLFYPDQPLNDLGNGQRRSLLDTTAAEVLLDFTPDHSIRPLIFPPADQAEPVTDDTP